MVTHALIRLAPYSHTPSSMLIKSLCRRYTEHISPSASGLRRTSFVRPFSLVSAVWREVIGIDFSRVSAAVMDEDGNPKMIEISDRKICMPPVVSFDQNGKTSVGGTHPKDVILDQTVFGIKRLIGRSYDELDDTELKKLREKLVPYEIIPPDSTGEEEEEEEAWIGLTNGKKYSPTYFASFIIGKLIDETAKCRGNIYASHAVVSVPPFFDGAQRFALKVAAERHKPLGQLLVDVLDESFAASLYYMTKSNTKKGRFAVIDIGGGSFDISIINASNTICGPQIKKIATKHEDSSSMKEFEDHSIKHLCWSCLKEANMRPKEVDEVLLVGGMSRVPRVWELVKEIFGKRPVEEVNPDEAVALGAAIMANLNANRNGN